MPEPWNVLVVDDEPDMHTVTELAIKRRSWRERPFKITSAHSAREARELLTAKANQSFDVALVDVVMETSDAGLQLCRFIRERLPLSLRIILRTGQPGVAPEDEVLNTYDIDQYLAKTEATPDKLYAAMRMALRSSQDIASTIFFSTQLRAFALALQSSDTTADTLLDLMAAQLRQLEAKHDVALAFVQAEHARGRGDLDEARRAIAATSSPPFVLMPAASGSGWVMPTSAAIHETTTSGGLLQRTRALLRSLIDSDSGRVETHLPSGFYVSGGSLSERALAELTRDLAQCADAWNVNFALFQLQAAIVEKRVQAIDSTSRAGLI